MNYYRIDGIANVFPQSSTVQQVDDLLTDFCILLFHCTQTKNLTRKHLILESTGLSPFSRIVPRETSLHSQRVRIRYLTKTTIICCKATIVLCMQYHGAIRISVARAARTVHVNP